MENASFDYVLLPEDDRASEATQDVVWRTSDGRLALVYENGLFIIEEPAPKYDFETVWASEIAEGYPGRLLKIRRGVVAVGVDASSRTLERAGVFFVENGTQFKIFGPNVTVDDLIAVAESMKVSS